MSNVIHFVKKLAKRETGATALEYGLIAALIAAAIVTSVGTLGTNISATFTSIAGHI